MTVAELQAENAELRQRLEEAEETVRAIRDGAVDAFVVAEPDGNKIYTLENADRPYRLLVEQMQQGAATLQADGMIVWCNRRLAELLDVPHERLVGAKLHEFFAPEDRSVYDHLLWEGQFRTGRGEAHLRRSDGGLLPAYLTFNVLPKDCGAALGVLVTDLTAQRHQEQLAAAHETLRASEARLQHVMIELREADRRKDEFLAVLAHELRNPLAPISNSLHILRMTSKHDPGVDRVGEMMERQVNHMVRLVDDLLEVSRITRGNIELRKEPIAVAAIVRSAVETSQPLIEIANHQFVQSLPAEPLTVDGDPVRLTQVVANLLNNAAKYTDPGGQIWLNVRREDQWVAISVRDTGIGIDTSMLPRVFDLFTQVDRHTDRAQGGLGIGLTLVKSLVEMHGGTVQVHSEGKGRGSEFVVRLPLAAARVATDMPGKDTHESATLGTRRVLVVDDNHDAADSLGLLLKLLGVDVHVVYNGPDALEAFATYKPAVVFLDIGMPGMDGHEAARRMRELPLSREVTFIALTGWGQEEARNRSQIAGFDYHLIKPADIGALQTLLASLEGPAGIRRTRR
jgi:PAS domain S-box-containing protein